MKCADIRKINTEAINSLVQLKIFIEFPKDLKKRFLIDLLSFGETDKAAELANLSRDVREAYNKIPPKHLSLIKSIKAGITDPSLYIYHKEIFVGDYARYFLEQYKEFSEAHHTIYSLKSIAIEEDDEQRAFAERKLCHIATHSLDEEERADAIGILIELAVKSDIVVETLIKASFDKDYLVKWIALYGLINLSFESEDVILAFINALDDTSPEIRLTGLKGLSSIAKSDQVVHMALVNVASYDTDPEIRNLSKKILNEIKYCTSAYSNNFQTENNISKKNQIKIPFCSNIFSMVTS